MLFDSVGNENIVIVPPKPDAFHNHTDEFTYSNLYDYDDCCGASTATATTAATFQSVTNIPHGSSSDVVAESNPDASSSTLSSSNAGGERSLGAVSFDSSIFDGVAAAGLDGPRAVAPSNGDNITRDPRNGAFTFQVHSEYDLLLHVQKDLDKCRRAVVVTGDASDGSSDVRLSETIMRSVDEYCLRKQWMYHIGREKGVAITRFLREGAEHYLRSGKGKRDGQAKKFTCVDLGTYCGYSALVMASALRGFIQDLRQKGQIKGKEPTPFEFHIYTTEVSTKLINVAQSMFRLAKMDAHITPILIKGEGEESLSASLRRHGVEGVVDFLLLDHAKHLYLDDLRDLEGAGLIGAGSRVGADNVVFNRLDAYRDHVRHLASQGVAETRLEEMNLEYSNNLKDGLELTVYLQDPPSLDE